MFLRSEKAKGFLQSFMAAGTEMLAQKQGEEAFRDIHAGFKAGAHWSAHSLEETETSLQFLLTYSFDSNRGRAGAVVGSLALRFDRPDVIEAKIYDSTYGWQAEPTLIPLDAASLEHQAAMKQFTKNILCESSITQFADKPEAAVMQAF